MAFGDIRDRSSEAELLESDGVHSQIIGGVMLGIVLVKTEAMVGGNLLPQRLAFGGMF